MCWLKWKIASYFVFLLVNNYSLEPYFLFIFITVARFKTYLISWGLNLIIFLMFIKVLLKFDKISEPPFFTRIKGKWFHSTSITRISNQTLCPKEQNTNVQIRFVWLLPNLKPEGTGWNTSWCLLHLLIAIHTVESVSSAVAGFILSRDQGAPRFSLNVAGCCNRLCPPPSFV